MRAISARDKTPLRYSGLDSFENEAFSRFATLAETVFGAPPSPPWPVAAFFDQSGRCVAGLQCHILEIECDGSSVPFAALRNVAVAEDWRGNGLMRDLLERVLPWCDAHADLAMLYAEAPRLYTRFGFAPMPQYAFEGSAPPPKGMVGARRIDLERDADLICRLLVARSPLSQVSVTEDGGMTAETLSGSQWALSYDATLDAMIVWETDGDTLVLVDVVAPHLPTAARILGSLGAGPTRLRTLFRPDRLGWDNARPVEDDTGLMVRGTEPAAMRRPFMLPPTIGF